MELTYKTEIEISELVVPSRFHNLLGEAEDGYFYPEIEINLYVESELAFGEKEFYITEQTISIGGNIVDPLLCKLLLAADITIQDDLYKFVYEQAEKIAKEDRY